jgi:hypothetical protein
VVLLKLLAHTCAMVVFFPGLSSQCITRSPLIAFDADVPNAAFSCLQLPWKSVLRPAADVGRPYPNVSYYFSQLLTGLMYAKSRAATSNAMQ